MIKKICNIVMLALLAACVCFPFVFMNTEEEVFSEADNRYLLETPQRADYETGQEYREQLEEYVKDRIADRSQLMTFYGIFNQVAFNYLAHPLYEVGLDGQAFFWFDNEQADMDYITAYANYIQEMYEYCQERGVPFVYVNSPEKKQVYAEYVPSYVPTPLDKFEYLAPLLEERGVPYIDLTEPLLQAHEEGVCVYNKVYDVGHWNAEGALIGAQTIIEYLQDAGYNVEQPDIKNDYNTVYEHHDYLPSSVLYYPCDTYKYIHKDNGTGAVDVTSESAPLDLYPTYNTYTLWENSACENDLNLLMFQGSYFNTQGTVLYNQFAHTECIHAYMNIFDLEEYFEMFDPDIVIFESANYAISSSYYTYEGLTETELS